MPAADHHNAGTGYHYDPLPHPGHGYTDHHYGSPHASPHTMPHASPHTMPHAAPHAMPLVRNPRSRAQHRPSAPQPRRDVSKLVMCFCCCALLTAVLISTFSMLHFFGQPAPFDCKAGVENAAVGWSDSKKEYCCEHEGMACQFMPSGGQSQDLYEEPPEWLSWWMGDLAVGTKFLLTGILATLIGCACGGSMYISYLKAEMTERRAETEHELMHELQKALQRVGAKTGEIVVTLMWDTKDDLDLHVMLPGQYGEISAENPEVAGGRLDIDGNHVLETASSRPIENIYWPHCDRTSHNAPPKGEYTVYVKVKERHSHHSESEANLTVVTTVQNKKDIYHLRLLPGCTTVHVGTFQYNGPSKRSH